jgi:group II intron reverse transcriptase/maturase
MDLIDQILSPDNLRLAWQEVAENKGAPGVDQVSITRWERNWEERVHALAATVRANTYRPRPLRRFTILKKDGSPRRMGIPTVTDRVLQRAVLRVVDDLFDKAFLTCNFGYRAGLGLRQAVPAILAHRDSGRLWVLDADIDNCFESLDHGLILDFFSETIEDAVVLRLLEAWLKIGRPIPENPVGVSQGAVLSPLLCNVVLHRLDSGLVRRGRHPIRYADDFCVFCKTEAQAEKVQVEAQNILDALKLHFEPAKTSITHFYEGFDFLGIHFYRDSYSYLSREKRVEVKGNFDERQFYDFEPDGYG